jgi:hypothetical protein
MSHRPEAGFAALAFWIAAAAQAGLVNYWAFNGTLADTASDCPFNTGASATHMMSYGAAPAYVPGPLPGTQGIQTSPRGVIITLDVLNGTADVAFAPSSTLAFWVKLPASSPQAACEFFADGDRFDHVLMVYWWASSNLLTYVSNVPGDTSPLGLIVPPGEWRFLTMTCDDAQNLRSIYLDGILATNGVYLEAGTPHPKYLCLGPPNKSTYWSSTAFARMSVWDHSMSEDEVKWLYRHDGDPRVRFFNGSGAILLVRW